MKESVVVAIGSEAIAKEDKMMILFDETATDEIKKVAVIHESLDKNIPYELTKGTVIYFGDQKYIVDELGERVNHSLDLMGHATILFKERQQEDLLPNAVYVVPTVFPEVTTGTTITFN